MHEKKAMESSKEQYIRFCEQNDSIPIFMQAWWMDAVCEKGEWNVLLYKESGEIRGVLVYYTVKKIGFQFILQPPLTQYNGIWLNYKDNQSENDKIHFEKKVIKNLIQQLDDLKFSYYNQNYNTNFKNWLPLYWSGFKQTTRYSYQIKDISDPEKCYQNFDYSKQKQIKKCTDSLHTIEINEDEFYDLLVLNYKEKKQEVLFSRNFFKRLYKACIEHQQGKIVAVADKQENIHAALFIVYDNYTSYDLISAIHPDFKSSGGSTLVVYEAIKQMSKLVKTFDFEGSMDQNIENSFSKFGTEQTAYFNISKSNSFLSKIYFDFFHR